MFFYIQCFEKYINIFLKSSLFRKRIPHYLFALHPIQIRLKDRYTLLDRAIKQFINDKQLMICNFLYLNWINKRKEKSLSICQT